MAMKYVLAVCAGVVATMMLIVALKSGASHRMPMVHAGVMEATRERPIDVLFLGSSHTMEGYDLATLERRTGGRMYALAYSALDPVHMEILWRESLARGVHPKAVVVEGYPAMLSRSPQLADARIYFEAPPQAKWKILRAYQRSHPGARGWEDLFALVVNQKNDEVAAELVVPRLDRTRYHDGLPMEPPLAGMDAEQFKHSHLRISTEVQEEQVAALRNIVREARENGIEIVCIEPPMPATVESQPEMQRLRQVLKRLLEEEHVRYVNGADDFPTTDASMFADSNHLSGEGRAEFMRRVEPEIARTFRK
jgi:hypothetical protein